VLERLLLDRGIDEVAKCGLATDYCVVLAAGPTIVGNGLLLSSFVSRWSARHKLFA
jgi:hypothetical protein